MNMFAFSLFMLGVATVCIALAMGLLLYIWKKYPDNFSNQTRN